jgi:hypothetical protein
LELAAVGKSIQRNKILCEHSKLFCIAIISIIIIIIKTNGLGVGAAQGTLRDDPIRINGPELIAAFPRENMRIGAADMLCHGPTSWIYSSAISQNGQNRMFFGLRIGKDQLGTRFYRESAGAKPENGNSPANLLSLWGLMAARLV